MKSVYKIKSVALLFLVGLLTFTAFAGTQKDFTKTIKKEFGITADGQTVLSNRYGKVVVNTWDKNRVKIEVRITVRTATEEKAQRVFDQIAVNFTNTPSMVKAETVINSSKSGWSWSSWVSDMKTDYSIDYEVFMPATCDLDLSNIYGDAFIGNTNGQVNMNIKYGNFQAEEIGDALRVNLGYGNGTIVNAKNIDANGSYCQLRLKKAKDVNLNSKYSKVFIETAGDIRCNTQYDSYQIQTARDLKNEGKYDNFEIGHADNLNVISKYSEIKINKLINNASLDLKYGGMTVNQLAKGFGEIAINGNYAHFKIKVEDGANYQVNATADYAGIRYPSSMQVVNEKEKGTYHEVSGYNGQKGARSVIKANINYGGLKVW